MPIETIGEYEIDYRGMFLTDVDGWAAHVTVYGPSCNPMHREPVMPDQRVAIEQVFATEQEAEAAARVAALEMLP